MKKENFMRKLTINLCILLLTNLLCSLNLLGKDHKSGSNLIQEIYQQSDLTKFCPLIVLELYGPDCGACIMFKKEYEKLAQEHPDVKFLKINSVKHPEIASKYKITSFPSFVFLANNNTDKPLKIVVGAKREDLKKAIKEFTTTKTQNAKQSASSSSNQATTTNTGSTTNTASTSSAPQPTNNIIDISSQDQLDELLKNSSTPVILDYHAEGWCGPCKMYKSLFGTLAAQYPKFQFIKANHDVKPNQSIGTKYGVTGFPTTIIFVNGQKTKTITGINLAEIQKELNALS